LSKAKNILFWQLVENLSAALYKGLTLSVTLSNFKFNDLLPSSVKDDPKFKAASECLDKLFESFDERLKSMLVYSRIDELDEQALDNLAWQWNIGYYEGYSLTSNIEEKRGLVKLAIQLHWHKGTRWAIGKIGEMLNMPIDIVEWWEPQGIAQGMAPYEFEVFVDTSQKGSYEGLQEDIVRIVNNLKNVRSYLRKIQAIMAWRAKVYLAHAFQSVEVGHVLPQISRGSEQTFPVYVAVGMYGAVTGRVLPLRIVIQETGDSDIMNESGDMPETIQEIGWLYER